MGEFLESNYNGNNKEELRYFKEELVSDIIYIPNNRPDIKRILSIDIWPEVMSTSVVESESGISNEGQRLTGVKLLVDIKINTKVAYVAHDRFNSSNILRVENIKSIYICFPNMINGKNVKELIDLKRVNLIPRIEDDLVRVLNHKSIQVSALLFVEANVY